MGAGGADRRRRTRLAADLQRRSPVRRGGGAVRPAGAGRSRGPGGGGARVGGRPRRARRLSAAPGRERAGRRPVAGGRWRHSTPARRSAPWSHDLDRGTARRRRRGALPQRARARDRRGLRARGRPARDRARRPLRGRVPERASCSHRTRALLEGRGLSVLVPERLPPNDGGIAFGQAAAAAAQRGRLRSGAPAAAARSRTAPARRPRPPPAARPARGRFRCRSARPRSRARPGGRAAGPGRGRARSPRRARARGSRRLRSGRGPSSSLPTSTRWIRPGCSPGTASITITSLASAQSSIRSLGSRSCSTARMSGARSGDQPGRPRAPRRRRRAAGSPARRPVSRRRDIAGG